MHGDILKLNLYKIFMAIFMPRLPSAGEKASDIRTAGRKIPGHGYVGEKYVERKIRFLSEQE